MMYLILFLQLLFLARTMQIRHHRVRVYKEQKAAPVIHINGVDSIARFTPAHGVKHLNQ